MLRGRKRVGRSGFTVHLRVHGRLALARKQTLKLILTNSLYRSLQPVVRWIGVYLSTLVVNGLLATATKIHQQTIRVMYSRTYC